VGIALHYSDLLHDVIATSMSLGPTSCLPPMVVCFVRSAWAVIFSRRGSSLCQTEGPECKPFFPWVCVMGSQQRVVPSRVSGASTPVDLPANGP
jgi:hypothetical protein